MIDTHCCSQPAELLVESLCLQADSAVDIDAFLKIFIFCFDVLL